MVGDKNDVDIGIHALDLLRQHGPVQAETVENRVGQQHVAAFSLCHGLRFARIAANRNVRAENERSGIPFQLSELGSILFHAEYVHSMISLPCHSL